VVDASSAIPGTSWNERSCRGLRGHDLLRRLWRPKGTDRRCSSPGRTPSTTKRLPRPRSVRIQIGDLIDEGQRSCWYPDAAVELTKIEFDLLLTLATNKQVVIERTQLYELVWGYDLTTELVNLASFPFDESPTELLDLASFPVDESRPNCSILASSPMEPSQHFA